MEQDDLRVEVPGSLGTSASFALQLGQTVFSSASLLFMCVDVDFYSYTYLLLFGNSHGFGDSMEPDTAGGGCIFCLCQMFSTTTPNRFHHSFGDMVLSYLSLAAACSTASVADLLLDAGWPGKVVQ